ncbi:hypothetical protein [Mycolicibacterium sp.]|uniref:hypothetical protein n=1 Tax=Mycolicibacterium sp. TaxID=2320850 RepID=UPI0025DAD2FF|nr:hypothetical protein [Mycolicibacterium sp.]
MPVRVGCRIGIDANGVIDPGVARAGAAVTARLVKLDLSRRKPARDGIINAGSLAVLEDGKRWPRTSTLRPQ